MQLYTIDCKAGADDADDIYHDDSGDSDSVCGADDAFGY